jgi:hypothetical protein
VTTAEIENRLVISSLRHIFAATHSARPGAGVGPGVRGYEGSAARCSRIQSAAGLHLTDPPLRMGPEKVLKRGGYPTARV